MARPTKCSPIVQDGLLKALRGGNTRTAAAAAVGIDRTTLTRWLARSATLRVDVEKAEADAERRAVGQIRSAMRTSWTAAAWWLERRRPEEWGKVDRVEITIREQAEKLARDLGMNADDLVRKAEEIAANA